MFRFARKPKIPLLKRSFSGFSGKSVMITAPLIKNRKGSYREVFEKAHNKGFERLVVDEQIVGTLSVPYVRQIQRAQH